MAELPAHERSVHVTAPAGATGQVSTSQVAPGALPPSPTGPSYPGGINWKRYVLAVYRYKWLILALSAVGAAAGLAVTRFMEPTYVAQATLWIEAGNRSNDRGPVQTPAMMPDPNAWTDLLRSFVVLDSVVMSERLYVRRDPNDDGIFSSFDVRSGFRAGEYVLEVDASGNWRLLDERGTLLEQGSRGVKVGESLGFDWVPGADELRPGRRIKFGVDNPRDAAQRLRSDLEAGLQRGQTLLSVQLRGTNPQRITSTLNALIDRYLQVAAEKKRERLVLRESILQEQLQMAAAELQRASEALEQHRVDVATLPSAEITIVPGAQIALGPVADYRQLQAAREEMRRDREAIERVLSQVRTGAPLPTEALEAVPAVRGATELSTALRSLAERRIEYEALRQQYTDQHPDVVRVLTQINALELGTIPMLASRLVAELRTRESELDSRVELAAAELQEIPRRSAREAELEQAKSIAENLYTMLQSETEIARLAAITTVPDVSIVDRAAVPRRPVSDDRYRVLLLGLAAGFGIALVAALLLDYFDPRLRYPEQVTQELGIPVLGAVPYVAGSNGRRVARAAGAIEAFRSIRLSLAHVHGNGDPLLLAVSSAGPGDGKSFVSANLALAFADQGRPTLLIDADVRRGDVHHLIRARRKPGLIDYLSGTVERSDLIQTTANPYLHFIGGGTRKTEGPELLGSSRLLSLLDELRNKYSVIIIDTPPMGVGADPFLIATLTGNLLFVLRTGSTDRQLASAKLDMVDQLPIRLLGGVLNAVPPTGAYKYYSYYLPGYESKDEEAPAALVAAQHESPGLAL